MRSRWVIQAGLPPTTDIPTGDKRGESHHEDGGRDLERSGHKPRKLATTKCGGARNRPSPENLGEKRPCQSMPGQSLGLGAVRECISLVTAGGLCSCVPAAPGGTRFQLRAPGPSAPRPSHAPGHPRGSRALLGAGRGAVSGCHLPVFLLPALSFHFLVTPSCPWSSFPPAQVHNASTLLGGSARIPRPLSKDATGPWGLGDPFRTSRVPSLAHRGFEGGARVKTDVGLSPDTVPRAAFCFASSHHGPPRPTFSRSWPPEIGSSASLRRVGTAPESRTAGRLGEGPELINSHTL